MNAVPAPRSKDSLREAMRRKQFIARMERKLALKRVRQDERRLVLVYRSRLSRSVVRVV